MTKEIENGEWVSEKLAEVFAGFSPELQERAFHVNKTHKRWFGALDLLVQMRVNLQNGLPEVEARRMLAFPLGDAVVMEWDPEMGGILEVNPHPKLRVRVIVAEDGPFMYVPEGDWTADEWVLASWLYESCEGKGWWGVTGWSVESAVEQVEEGAPTHPPRGGGQSRTTHTVDRLHAALPQFKGNIRRSRVMSKAAVIATGPDAARSLVVTLAGVGEDYHLCHVVEVPPRELMDSSIGGYPSEELRPEKWARLERVITVFLEGASIDHLIEVAAGRDRGAAQQLVADEYERHLDQVGAAQHLAADEEVGEMLGDTSDPQT